MENNEKEIEILNDLLRINNDRVEGYLEAADEVDDSELKKVFIDMAGVSRGMVIALTREISDLSGHADEDSTTNAGKIYRVWMDVRNTFSSKDSETALKSCEFGEDAAQNAYESALENRLSAYLRSLINTQKTTLKDCHDLIKNKRDELVRMN